MTFQEYCQIFSSVFLCWTTICHFSHGTATQQLNDFDINGNELGSSFFFYQQSTHPRDCSEVQKQCSSHDSTGVYLIKPDGYLDPFEVYCDSANDSTGWTVIQRRIDGSVDFNRDWESYKSGFGFLSREFWLGNEKIAFLTNQKKYQLVVEITSFNDTLIRIAYDSFRLSDGFGEYALSSLGQYSGTTDAITFCPSNMVFKNCSNACQRTCGTPDLCHEVSCTDVEACVCPDGFFMKGSDCVPREDCGCYESEGETIIPEGESYVNPGCTRKGACSNGRVNWDDSYACSSNAVCDVRNNKRQCYCTGGYRGDGETCTRPPKDCQEIYEDGTTDSGMYRIQPTDWTGQAFEVYCNMSDGGGWTVFQRRDDGSQDFNLNWNDYKQGFGDMDNEFWLGNDKLYYLTNQKRYEIRIDLVQKNGGPYYAEYNYFRINDENSNYLLSGLGDYSGTVGFDAMNPHRGQPFSTRDRDNDGYSSYTCGSNYNAGWWYFGSDVNGYRCYNASPNYPWSSRPCWYNFPGGNHNIQYIEMKIRPL